jgi:hypothetical protein
MPVGVARIERSEIREHACARPMPTPDFSSFNPGYWLDVPGIARLEGVGHGAACRWV